MLNQNALTPLYEQLKNAIKDDIHAQIYRPGDRMPSEAELEEKYQVSRITVRRAVKELCEEEILVRKQGKGTFVLSTGVQSRIDQLDFMIPWRAREERFGRRYWRNPLFS